MKMTRDIVNAPQLKNSIVQRSQQRQDAPEITQWLEKKFFEHLIQQFQPVARINSLQAWQMCQLPQPVPQWFRLKLDDQHAEMLYIDPYHQQITQLEKPLLEFFNAHLHTPLARKFMKMTYEQVMQAWQKDHERMKKRLAKGQWASNLQAIQPILSVETGQFVEIVARGQLLRQELAYESWHMQHCLGQFEDLEVLTGGYAEYYVTEKEEGMLRLFSLRDAHNKPHVTLSLERDMTGTGWRIEQIKGKQNAVPIAKYADDVLSLLNFLAPSSESNPDCLNMGILYRPELEQDQQLQQETGDLYFYFHELKHEQAVESIVFEHPWLLQRFPVETACLNWILLAGRATQDTELPQQPTEHSIVQAVRQYQQQVRASDLNSLQQFPYFNLPFQFKATQAPSFARRMLMLYLMLWVLFWAMLSRIPIIKGCFYGITKYCYRLVVSLRNSGYEAQRWALATGDVIYYRQGILQEVTSEKLQSEVFEQNKTQYLSHLNRMLEIKSNSPIHRERQLLKFLKDYFVTDQLDQIYQLSYAKAHQHLRDMIVFDHIQKIFLMRLLVQFYQFSEQVAWSYIFASAQIIQDCCSNWESLGDAYVKGRELILLILTSHDENIDRSATVDVSRYLQHHQNNWDYLAWDLSFLQELQLEQAA